LGDLLTANVMLGKVEECVVDQQLILEVIALGRFDFHVRRDAAAAVHGASAVGKLYFFVGVVVFDFAVVVVVIERNAAVFALDQASAGGVILGSGQRQTGVIGERIHGLHQTFAEGGLACDESAIMVLYSTSDNFSRRSRTPIYQHHERIILAAIALGRFVLLIR